MHVEYYHAIIVLGYRVSDRSMRKRCDTAEKACRTNTRTSGREKLSTIDRVIHSTTGVSS
jgi:hypothetical protein